MYARRPLTCLPKSAAPQRVPPSSSARRALRRIHSWVSPFRSPSIASPRNPNPLVIEYSALTEDEFRRLCEYLYRRTGMIFTESKRYYVERRVFERMTATGAQSFASYFARLRTNAQGEIEQFVNAFTVNETYFYREDHQLKCLTTDILADRVRAKSKGDTLRIWSVPCATGEEPYSVAMWLLENWSLVDKYEIEIIGSDIDTRVLQFARDGVFGQRALMRLSPQLIEKYFTPLPGDRWQILDDLRDSVQFSAVNIVEAAETRPQGQFDVIFCRNVLIYFDDASRRTAAENLFENLLPGGYICLGHTESMSRISPLFEVRRFADAIVYQRPAPSTANG
jgi:chemotaxis protein methyltransferase CheR